MVNDRPATTGVSRRTVTGLVGASAVGLPLLSACGGSGSAATDTGHSGERLAATTEIPVGGGKIFTSQHVVVTQPEAGEFKGFSSFCTHQSCQVAKVEAGTILCPCHGSTYSISDGSVQGGPAPRPLPGIALVVRGDQISIA